MKRVFLLFALVLPLIGTAQKEFAYDYAGLHPREIVVEVGDISPEAVKDGIRYFMQMSFDYPGKHILHVKTTGDSTNVVLQWHTTGKMYRHLVMIDTFPVRVKVRIFITDGKYHFIPMGITAEWNGTEFNMLRPNNRFYENDGVVQRSYIHTEYIKLDAYLNYINQRTLRLILYRTSKAKTILKNPKNKDDGKH